MLRSGGGRQAAGGGPSAAASYGPAEAGAPGAARVSIFSVPRPARLRESVRARLRAPDIATDEVRAVLGQYGLAPLGRPGNLSASRRNHNVVVATQAGRKLLKRYRPQWQAETVRYGHAILDRLAELGFPVPRLATALDGESFVSRGGHHYALLEFVAGVSYSARFLLRADRRRLMALAGATMGRLHRALEGFTPVGRHHLGFAGYSGGRGRDAVWHLARLDELCGRSLELARPAEQPLANWLVLNAGAVAERLGPLDRLLAAAPLTRTVIHGDYGLHNLLFRGDGAVIPLDFELARIEWRLSDLVSCLSRLRFGAGAYDFASSAWFMAAYELECPLSADEWRLLPLVWQHYKLQGAVQYWSSYFESGGPARKLASARDAIEQALWAARNGEALRAGLRGPLHRPRG